MNDDLRGHSYYYLETFVGIGVVQKITQLHASCIHNLAIYMNVFFFKV